MVDATNRQPGQVSLASRSADFLVNLAMASLALIVTGVSAYTTYKGMIRIVGADAPAAGIESWLPVIVAGSITAVVQIGLTILCWVTGRDFARSITARLHERKRRSSMATTASKMGAMLALILICLAVSVFYSFNTYFNSMYEGKEEKRVEARAVPAVSLQIATLLGEAIAEQRASRIENIRELAEASQYFVTLASLARTVEETAPRYAARFEKIRTEKIEAGKTRLEAEFDIRARIDSTTRAIDEKAGELAQLDARTLAAQEAVSLANQHIATLRAQEQLQREEADKQLRGDEERASGRGKVYAQSIAAAQAAALAIVIEQEAIATARRKIEELEGRRLELEKSIGLARLDIDAANPQAGTSESSGSLPISSVGAIAEAVAAMEGSRTAFEQTPSTSAYAALQSSCQVVREIGLGDDAARSAADASHCKARSDTLDAAMEVFTDEEVKRAEFIKNCGTLGNGSLAPAKAVETLRQCHFRAVATGVDADSRKAQKAFQSVESFAGKFDKEQHPFLKTLQAFSVSPRLAALALFFAIMQDVAVFIMTFMVEFFRRERELAREDRASIHLGEQEIEAIRYVLAKCEPMPGRRDSHVFRFSAERQSFLSTDENLAIKAVIEDLRGRGLASATSRVAYVVSSAGYVSLQTRLRQSPDAGIADPSRMAAARNARQGGARPVETSENVLDLSAHKKSS